MDQINLKSVESSWLKLSLVLLAVAVGGFLYSLHQTYSGPLKNIPGPFLARFTKLWELVQVRKGHFEETNLELHGKYGSIVRTSPNSYSVSDPSAVKTIYGHGSKFVKGPFYSTFQDPHQSNLFSEIDPQIHGANRRRVASLYSMTTLLSYEPFVDNASTELCGHLAYFAKEGMSFQVPDWMQFYAFDVIGEITVGESFGFMKNGSDHNGIIRAIHDSMVYGSRVGLFAEWHPWIVGVSKALKLPTPVDAVTNYIWKNINARRAGYQTSDRNDFLTKLLELRAKDKVQEMDLHTTVGANIAAGSDTTGISLSTVIYYLAKYPGTAKKLQEEIDEFSAIGRISDPVTFQEAQQMPYLQAVIKEALRIHPAVGQPMPRIVPAEGATLAGQFFPGGISVATSAWVMHYNKQVFGNDAAEFRPERWLGKKEDISIMEQNFLSFGVGARTCIGKNISLLEMTKVVPQIYRKFNLFLVEPSKEWELDTVWFVKQKYECHVQMR